MTTCAPAPGSYLFFVTALSAPKLPLLTKGDDVRSGGNRPLDRAWHRKLQGSGWYPFYPAVPCNAAGNVSPARRGAVQRKLAAAPLTAISAAVSKLVT